MTQFGKPLPSPLVPTSRSSSLLTYEPYFGLKEKPFSLASDPRFLYKSPSHAPTFEELRAGIRRREGLIVLTGDIGMGKTTLCKAVIEELDRKTFSAFVPDPFLSREDLLKMLLVDFGATSIDELKSGRLGGASRSDLSYTLYDFLKSLVPLQAFAVLILDEAQNLPVPLLEEIRILSDLEAPEKLLQVVLVGQLELQDKLKLPEMRQVDQRVSVRCELKPMTREVLSGYITHRLEVAAAGPARVDFSAAALEEIYRVSNGVPRVVNLVCDRALHHGHLERTSHIHAPHVVRATIDLGLRAKPVEVAPPSPPPRRPALHPDALATESPSRPVPEPPLHEIGFGKFDLGEDAEPNRIKNIAVIIGAALAVVGVIVAVLYGLTGRSSSRALALPPLPGLPSAAHDRAVNTLPMHIAASIAMVESPAVYAIDVALFDSPSRATSLVQQLSAKGFPVYSEVRRFSGQPKYVVRIGPYIVLADADTDLTRIHQVPGYHDARVSAVFADTP